MKELHGLTRSLRGSDVDDVDSAGILSKVKDLAVSYLSSIQAIRGHVEVGNKEKAAAELKAIVGDEGNLIKGSRSAKLLGTGIGFPQPSDGVAFSDANPLPKLSDIPDAQMAEFIEPQVLDELADHAQDLVNVIEGIEPAMRLSTMNQKKKKEKKEQATTQQRSDKGFMFESDTSESAGSNGRKSHNHRFHFHPQDLFKQQQTGKFSLGNFMNHPSIKRMIPLHTTGAGSHTPPMSKLRKFGSSFFQKDDIIVAKHQARQEALLGVEGCDKICDPDEVLCNCENLFNCVKKMTKYDLAVLIAGGFIDTDPSSENFGNITVSAESLSLFDAEEGVKDKLDRIQKEAVDHTDLDQCKGVLSELFTACDPSSEATCSNPNIESFQVSTEHVCDVVDTPKKLKFETIGDEFDGFVDESTSGEFQTCDEESCFPYNLCFLHFIIIHLQPKNVSL